MNEFWAALIGAVVGGIISGAAAWWTTRTQWRKEHLAKRRERLEDQLGRATRMLSSRGPRSREGQWVTPVPSDAIQELHFARVSAAAISPHLSELIEEMFLDGALEWHAHIAAHDVRVLNGIVARWIEDPDRFDREQISLQDYRREFPTWEAIEAAPRRRTLAAAFATLMTRASRSGD